MDTLRVYECPECHKFRLYRPEGYKISQEITKKDLPSGEQISHFNDICDFCAVKIYNRYYKPNKSDAKKILQALEDGKSIGDKSLEELL